MLTGLIGRAATVQFVLNRRVCLMSNVIFVIGVLIQDRQTTRRNDDLWTRTTLTETTIGMPDKDLSAIRLEEHGDESFVKLDTHVGWIENRCRDANVLLQYLWLNRNGIGNQCRT